MTFEEAQRQLARHRARIDEIDVAILELINQRTEVVEEIGRIKRQLRLPIYEPKREDDVYRNLARNNRGPLSQEAVRRVFERIIEEMRTLQSERWPDDAQQAQK
ncbi:MAG: chorismate mutase [Bryobacteraceae bacterium]|nr:chorismate mutase [Bryobacteraceae bacterium]MDW8377890.1 chorismate mutase [Bryobacterales bacterium]